MGLIPGQKLKSHLFLACVCVCVCVYVYIYIYILYILYIYMDFPGGSDGKVTAYNLGDPVSIPGLGRSPGEGNGCPL